MSSHYQRQGAEFNLRTWRGIFGALVAALFDIADAIREHGK